MMYVDGIVVNKKVHQTVSIVFRINNKQMWKCLCINEAFNISLNLFINILSEYRGRL